MILVGVSSLLVQPPICAAENEQGAHVSHCASIAATFIGWYLVSITPRWLPTISTSIETGTITAIASLAVRTNGLGAALLAQMPGRDRQHDQAARQQRRQA